MNQSTNTIQPYHRNVARVAGLFYLIIFVAGIFAEMFVRSSLIVPMDASATATNIIASEGLFRIGIASDLLMIISDVVIGILFYVLLKPVNQTLALMAAFFRLAQAATLGLNLLNLMMVTQLLSGADYLAPLGTEQLHAQALLSLNAHAIGYRLSLVFFALSITILGYLIVKSGYFPKVLGILLVIASIGYLTDTFANVLLPNYEAYAELFDTLVVTPAFIAELALTVWLLIRGIRLPKQQDNAVSNPMQSEAPAY